jgi:hypothetical protein
MPTPSQLRTSLDTTLNHIRDVFNKLTPITSAYGTLRFPDLHKLSEGLFLSAWSHWEEFLRDLMIEDLADRAEGVLRSEVKKFRTKKAAFRLAERIVNHPDHPDRFIEWHNYKTLKDRAKALLGEGHRFVGLGDPWTSDLKKVHVLRNAIAHKSDKAWQDFIDLIKSAPFSLAGNSRRGITPGRFISAHNWKGKRVLLHTVITIKGAALKLVP